MRSFIFTAILLSAVHSSCDSGKGGIDSNAPGHKANDRSLMRMQFLYSEAENDFSFPFWFNADVIVDDRIKAIAREVYYPDSDEESSEGWSLRERRRYQFSSLGFPLTLSISNFFDDTQIGRQIFVFGPEYDRWGYNRCRIQKDTLEKNFKGNGDDPETLIRTFIPSATNRKFVVYEDEGTGDYRFFLVDKKYWGVLSVDSLLSPSPKDEVVYGRPLRPAKRFRLKNKVNEMDVVTYTYDKVTGQLLKMNRTDHPFEVKRSIVYDPEGFCQGYIDSTFTGDKYLTRVVAEFELDGRGRPNKVTVIKDNSGKKSVLWIEHFKYEFYE